jgi:RNA polymerase-binding transcription factor DksA
MSGDDAITVLEKLGRENDHLTQRLETVERLYNDACWLLRSPDLTNDGGPGLVEDIEALKQNYEVVNRENDRLRAALEDTKRLLEYERHMARLTGQDLSRQKEIETRLLAENYLLRTAIQRVRELHTPSDTTGWCKECDQPLPCPTLRALAEALGVD